MKLPVVDTLYGPDDHFGELCLEPRPGHSRPVKLLAFCPWCPANGVASLLADNPAGTFECLACGTSGVLTWTPGEPMSDSFVSVQREDFMTDFNRELRGMKR